MSSPLQGIRSIRDLPIENKRVFLRVDFNVPLEGSKITDDQAGMGGAHVDAPCQFRYGCRAGDAEPDEGGHVALPVAAPHLQNLRYLARPPSNGESQLW